MAPDIEKVNKEALFSPQERLVEVKDQTGRAVQINTCFLPQSEQSTPIPDTSFILVGGWRTQARNLEVMGQAFSRFAPVLIISHPEAPDSSIPRGPFNQHNFANSGFVQLAVVKQFLAEGRLKGKLVAVGWSQGGATLIEAAAHEEGIIDTLILADPGATFQQFLPRMIFHFGALSRTIIQEGWQRWTETRADSQERKERFQEALTEAGLVRDRVWPTEKKGVDRL